jgi:hypothetical protein
VLNTALIKTPSQAFIDASANFTTDDKHWTATISARNLSDN